MRSPFEPLWVASSLAAVLRGPAAIPAVGLGLSAVSTGMSVFGALSGQSAGQKQAEQQQAWGIYQQQQQAAAQAAQARWEGSLAGQRKEIAGRAVTDAEQRGDVAVKVQEFQNEVTRREGQREVAAVGGRQLASIASSGTDSSGSAGDALADTAQAGSERDRLAREFGNFDVATIRSNATREAYGHKLEVVNATNDESLAKAKDDNARPGQVALSYQPSNIGAAGSLLAGASNLAEKWWKFQQVGGFGGGGGGGSSGAYGKGAASPYVDF